MSTLDTVAGVALGGYLIAVAVNGNTQALITQAKKDKDFLKWAIAVGIAVYAYKVPALKGPVTAIISAAFIALFLQNGTKITQNATAFWASF